MTVVQPRFRINLIDPILLFQLRQILDMTYMDVARRRAYPIIDFIDDDKERLLERIAALNEGDSAALVAS
jgi:hypothetical protein